MSIYQQEWNKYENRFKSLMAWGAFNDLVKPLDKEIFTNSRDLFYNNIPAILLLLDYNLVQRHCYSRAKLISYMLHDKDAEVVVAKIDGLKYNPMCLEKRVNGEVDDKYSEHCYVRRKEDGRVWIYDTSLGLKIAESVYNDIQNPEIVSISKSLTDLNEIGISRYTLVDLDEKAPYIKGAIAALKDTLKPVRKDYEDLILDELETINKSLSKESKEKVYGKQM